MRRSDWYLATSYACYYSQMNKNLLAIYVINSINLAADNLILPLLALFVVETGGNAGIAGAVFATGKAAHLVGSFFVVRVHDSQRLQKIALLIGYATKAIAWGALAFFPYLWLIFVAQIVIGLSGAFGLASFQSYIAEHLDKQKHIREYGTLSIIEGVAAALGALAGGLLVAWQSFSVLLLTVAVVEIVAAVLFWRTFKVRFFRVHH